MYVKHYKISRNKQLNLIKYFVAGSMARTASELKAIPFLGDKSLP